MKRLAVVILVCSALSVSAYPISGDDVNCRSGPGTSYGVKKQYSKGHEVKLSCQTEGEKINGNSIWDKTTDGCYVSDYYVKTGVNGYVTSKCSSSGGGSSGGCSAPKSNKATVDLVAEFEGFRASVCKSRLPLAFSRARPAHGADHGTKIPTPLGTPRLDTATSARSPSAPR